MIAKKMAFEKYCTSVVHAQSGFSDRLQMLGMFRRKYSEVRYDTIDESIVLKITITKTTRGGSFMK